MDFFFALRAIGLKSTAHPRIFRIHVQWYGNLMAYFYVSFEQAAECSVNNTHAKSP